MKHKHAEMIKAKADNMELVVLAKTICDKVTGEPIKWAQVNMGEFGWLSDESREVFLCLPQHKEAVLNILNGGKSQVIYVVCWNDCNCGIPIKWEADWWYMDADCESRIKPKRVKRWIGVAGDVTTSKLYETREKCETAFRDESDIQFIEIEIEQ